VQGVLRFSAALVVSVAALVVAVSPEGARAAGSCEYDATWSAPDDGLARQVVELVNKHRAGLGLPAVDHSQTLVRVAEWKAGHMMANGYMDHDDPAPLNRTADQRLVDCGYDSPTWGENIASGQSSAKAVVDGWLTSEGHRANIEDPEFSAIGVAAISAEGRPVYWAQVFGAVGGGPSPASLLDAPARAPLPAAVRPASKQVRAPAGQKVGKRRTIKRRGRVAARRTRRVGISMRIATRLTVKVRVQGRRGARLLLRCGRRTKAKAVAGKGRAMTLRARRVGATSCRVIIRAPKRSVRYELTAVVR